MKNYERELIKLIVCAIIGAAIGIVAGIGMGSVGAGLLMFTGAPYAWLVLPKISIVSSSLIVTLFILALKITAIIFAGFIITPIAFIRTIVIISRNKRVY